MILPDVNVLVGAFREEADRHTDFRAWLLEASTANSPLGLTGVTVSGFVRVVTNVRVFVEPSDIDIALDFVAALRRRPSVVTVHPGPRHLEIFDQLCRSTRAAGNRVPDAYLASIAIEQRAQIATADRGFALFAGSGATFHHPLGE